MEQVKLHNELDAEGEAVLYEAMRSFWHAVSYSHDVTDRPKQAVLLGEKLVLARLNGELRCFADLCQHRGTELSLGWIDDDQLRCPYHGWTYGADGVCTSIPARFGGVIPSRARLRPYLVHEVQGIIWVCLQDEPVFPIPAFPEYDDPAYHIIAGPPYDWKTSAHRRLENFVDFAHFSWVHDGVLASREHPEVPDHEVWREGPELRFERQVREPVVGATNLDIETEDSWIDVHYTYFLSMPATIHFDRHFLPADDRYVLRMTATPIGPKQTRSFWFLARNYALDADDGDFLEFEKKVLDQDRPVVESQRPEMLPFDLSAELHIKGVDKVSLEYRKWLIELAGLT